MSVEIDEGGLASAIRAYVAAGKRGSDLQGAMSAAIAEYITATAEPGEGDDWQGIKGRSYDAGFAAGLRASPTPPAGYWRRYLTAPSGKEGDLRIPSDAPYIKPDIPVSGDEDVP